jgi:drug/metabolite transporter (DMT)-like permease
VITATAPPGRSHRVGVLCGLGAAVTFGASTPLAKGLLEELPGPTLAALLYGGATLALAAVPRSSRLRRNEPPLRREDAPPLALLALLGGVVGPLLLLWGLARVSALVASLLGNLEAAFTVVLAVVAFGEHLHRRGALGAVAVVAGGVALAAAPGDLSADPLGVAAIAGACAAWAVDNNLTRRLAVRDPVAVVRAKAAVATVGNGSIALAVGAVPAAGLGAEVAPAAVAALGLGAVSYGASILLDAYALRAIGAARQAAVFATAPFLGVAVAMAVRGERPTWLDVAAMVVMAAGIAALVAEPIEGLHAHAALRHAHRHLHAPSAGEGGPGPSGPGGHAHPHDHGPVLHDHPEEKGHPKHRHRRGPGPPGPGEGPRLDSGPPGAAT